MSQNFSERSADRASNGRRRSPSQSSVAEEEEEEESSEESSEEEMFPPDEAKRTTFKPERGRVRRFFVLPPQEGNMNDKIDYYRLIKLIEEGGGNVGKVITPLSINIIYNDQTVIPASLRRDGQVWYTADLIRRCIDCCSFETSIVQSEIVLAPIFDDDIPPPPASPVREPETPSEPEIEWPSLKWEPNDLLLKSCIRPLMEVTEEQLGKVQQHVAEDQRVQEEEYEALLRDAEEHHREEETRARNERQRRESLSQERTVSEPLVGGEDTTEETPASDALDAIEVSDDEFASPGNESTEPAPAKHLIKAYKLQRQKLTNLENALPDVPSNLINAVCDLYSGDTDEAYKQILLNGPDYNKIKVLPGVWRMRDDEYFQSSPGIWDIKIKRYTNEHILARKRYLLTLSDFKDVELWLKKRGK